jgi:hypothetical protein
MDELKLFDGKRIPINEGASLGHIECVVPNEAEALNVCEWLTPANCSHVEFIHDGMTIGTYDNTVISVAPSRTTNEDETVTVSFGLRMKSELEVRVDTHDDEITELQEAIAEEV